MCYIIKHRYDIIMYMFEETFVWYDLETFGLKPQYDRIAQFACQRTDMNLNPVADPEVIYCRLSADYIPDPKACLVTGITPQEVKEKGIPESEFIERINSIFSVPNTCVCGFNTIRFDDEMIRHALYRNFIDPYEREWRNGCTRWDIIDLVRACRDLRPEGIEWPVDANGKPVNKLTEITAANHIDQTGAHDAMVDVNATIAVARLIREKQPKLFNHYFELRKKKNVMNLVNLVQQKAQPLVLCAPEYSRSEGCTTIIAPLTPSADRESRILCFNLMKDPDALLCATPETIRKTPGVFTVAINKSPFIAPIGTISNDMWHRLGLDKDLIMERFDKVCKAGPKIIATLRNAPEPDYGDEISDVDYQLYCGGFFSDRDKAMFSLIRNCEPAKRLDYMSTRFDDPRVPQMLWRHVCRNYPELLEGEALAEWKSFASARLLQPLNNELNDIFFVERKIEENMADTTLDPDKKRILADLGAYCRSLRRYVGLSDRK